MTTKTNLPTIALSKLSSWPDIDGLTDASGIGTYTTKVSLNKEIKNTRILLDVGDVEGSWGVKLNGKYLTKTDWIGSQPFDVTDLIKNGKNGKDPTHTCPPAEYLTLTLNQMSK